MRSCCNSLEITDLVTECVEFGKSTCRNMNPDEIKQALKGILTATYAFMSQCSP